MIGNPLLLPDEGYNISRSVRLRSSASATFSRTPGSSSNRRTWTWSAWVKRGQLATTLGLFSAKQTKDDITGLYFGSSDKFVFIDRPGGVTNALLISTMVLRDPSAWYHIIFQADTTNATSSDRLKLYVNGVRVTVFDSATYPSQNYELAYINNTVDHRIGAFQDNTPLYFDGYLTEINFIDGQALTPSSFGETDSITGVWKPKKYTGTYGTNGFFLNFSDNSNNTAATIGKDYSGNGNNWTPNNISVTSGSTYDSMLDVPTQWADGGNGRGNYCTLNPLKSYGGLNSANLGQYNATANWTTGTSTFYVSTGKWYWEVLYTNLTGSTYGMTGIVDNNFAQQTLGNYPGVSATSYAYYNADGKKYNAGAGATYGATYADNDVIGIALDMDAGTLTFYKNGVSQGTAFTGLSGTFTPAVGTYGSVGNINFGQRPFSYTPPSGFKALNTLNLPAPTILKGNQYFDAVTYAGSASQQTITTSLVGLDFAWIKNRTTARDHVLVDTVRGGSPLLTLYSDLTAAEDNSSPNYNPTSFTTSGIVLGGAKLGINNAGENFVLWGWKEGATQGFDIVTYTGTGSGTTVAHNLGVAPSWVIIKQRSASGNYFVVWARGTTSTSQALWLGATNAVLSTPNYWNSTAPTASVFSVGTDSATNGSGSTYVAYLFSEVAGFSRFGSYTGNGSTDGPFVFCGFRPRWVMIKRTDTSGFSWCLHDTARDPENPNDLLLYADASSAEAAANFVDMLSNGFKVRNLGGGWNASGGTYVYAAFSEHPFKNALAR